MAGFTRGTANAEPSIDGGTVVQFVTLAEIREMWPQTVGHLGQARPFWTWLLDTWSLTDRDR